MTVEVHIENIIKNIYLQKKLKRWVTGKRTEGNMKNY